MTSTGLLISSYTTTIYQNYLENEKSEYSNPTTKKYYYNNLVNLHNVTYLGLCNKYIFVTQKQVLELYITVIECKTLYSLCIPHTAFPNATRSQQPQLRQQQDNKGPCYQDRNRDLAVLDTLVTSKSEEILTFWLDSC